MSEREIHQPYIERLPCEINNHYLRIKARSTSKKKWCVRYIRKVKSTDRKIDGFKYRTEVQAWGTTLEKAAMKMLKQLEKYYPNKSIYKTNEKLPSRQKDVEDY